LSRIRRSATLVVEVDGSALVGHDFYSGRRTEISFAGLRALAALSDWSPPARAFASAARDRRALARELVALVDLGFVVVEGSAAAALDERLRRDWRWGSIAGRYHFGIKDPDYQKPDAAFRWVAQQVASEPEQPLYASHADRPDAVPLSAPPLDRGLLGLMAARRSYRGFDPVARLPLEALRDCLFAGMGITGFADAGVPGHAPLPLSMTPSGGARNPYEAYVVARAVEGLAPAAYHYAAVDHSLAPVAALPPSLGELLGGQDWFDHAGAVIVLVAHFPRCAWKYPHPTGYRVVVLEAGHIAQNVLLAATAHGLAATPTCAVADGKLEQLLGLDRVTQGVMHTVALGVRSPTPSMADLSDVRPNPRLGGILPR
jgi:SagB-type dehydrogenase family enzyme